MRETEPLLALAARYHGLQLEAHIVEVFANAVGTFMGRVAKPYILDPVLYRFSVPFYEDVAEKRWNDPLASSYGIDGILATRPQGFQGADFATQQTVDTVTASVLDYQRKRVPTLARQVSSLASLVGFPPPTAGPPELLTSPYVIITDQQSFNLNARFSIAAASQKLSGEKLYGVIAIPREFLGSPQNLKAIATAFSKLAIDGYLLWVTDMKDWVEDSSVLQAFVVFINDLKVTGSRQVVNLFGGYFSTIMAARGVLDGTVQGLGISEFRDPLGSGGGGGKRYYVPIARQVVSADLADSLKNADPVLFSCSCSQCSETSLPSALSVVQLARHFMETRIREMGTASGGSFQSIIDSLVTDYQSLDAVQAPGVYGMVKGFVRRLQVWEQTLHSLSASGIVR